MDDLDAYFMQRKPDSGNKKTIQFFNFLKYFKQQTPASGIKNLNFSKMTEKTLLDVINDSILLSVNLRLFILSHLVVKSRNVLEVVAWT